MNRRSKRLGIAVLLLFLSAHQLHAQTDKPLRILVDASKDGGLWWFPQGEAFNADQYHQGTQLAHRLKARGWYVTELGRGDTITESTLAGYDVIVIPQPFFRYLETEQRAYVAAVENGARLLLLGADRNAGIHSAFGFRFPFPSRFGSADTWVEHPINSRIEDLDVVWTPGFSSRREAVSVAFLGEGKQAIPIATYLPVGNGAVLYLGHSAVMSTSSVVQEHLADSVGALGADVIEHPDVSRIARPKRVSLVSAPVLLFPLATDPVSQPADEPWRFDWEDVPGAVAYELAVSGPNAAIPLILTQTSVSEFRPKPHPPVIAPSGEKRPFIADHNLRNWTWRVRARGDDGIWGAWSKAGRFNVRPVE